MKRHALAALSVLLAIAGCRAAPSGPPPSPALWEVTGPRGERAWLFGTVHALPDGLTWRTPQIDRTLKQADSLVVEVADLGDGQTGAVAFSAAARSDGLPPLSQRVPPAARAGLAAALKRAGMSENDFATTKTWAAALILANAADRGEAANGADRVLLEAGLPIVGLEGFAEQFAIFDRLPPADQADLLRLASEPDADAQDRRMTAAWRRGDLATLEREAQAGVLSDPELRQALLVARNRAWTARVLALLAQRRHPLVAVGAAHMLGSDGLPALLAARGYTVRRIE